MLPEGHVDARPPEETAVFFQALKDTAQLLDLHDRDGHWGSYQFEANWCRRCFRRCKNSPPLSDLHLLPSKEIIAAQIDFNRKHHEWLLDMRYARLYNYRKYADLAEENERIYVGLSAMMQACHHLSRHATGEIRQALETVREIFGLEAYYSGRWPPHVPLAGFEQR